jgi:hypothetical protein
MCRLSCPLGPGCSTGHGRKTNATDAHSIAVVAVRTPDLNQVTAPAPDDAAERSRTAHPALTHRWTAT